MGKSQTKAKNKYNEKTYDRIPIVVKKGVKDIWKSEAERQGLSLNGFICKAVGRYINECEKKDNYNRILSLSIEKLDMSLRSYNCLRRSGINTVGDLKKFLDGNHSLYGIRNLGAKNVNDVIEHLKSFEKANDISLDIDYNNII